MTRRRGFFWLLPLVALAIGALALPGLAIAEALNVPGSGNPEHVLGELARAFNAGQAQHHVTIPPTSGAAGAVRDVSSGIAGLGRIGRPLKVDERALGLVYVPLARDAIAIAAGAGVTARGIALAQVKAVFAGEITDWRELGGKPGPIRVIGKEPTDSTRQQFEKAHGTLIFGDAVKLVHLDNQLLELLDRYPTSFAIINRSALGACRTKVVTVALDGVESSPENIETGRYPLAMEWGVIHRTEGLTAAGRAFIDFIRSAEGKKILHDHGSHPLGVAR